MSPDFILKVTLLKISDENKLLLNQITLSKIEIQKKCSSIILSNFPKTHLQWQTQV